MREMSVNGDSKYAAEDQIEMKPYPPLVEIICTAEKLPVSGPSDEAILEFWMLNSMIDVKVETVIPLAIAWLIIRSFAWNQTDAGVKYFSSNALHSSFLFITAYFRKNYLNLAHVDWMPRKWVRTSLQLTCYQEELRVFWISKQLRKSLKNCLYHVVQHESRWLYFWCSFRSCLSHRPALSIFLTGAVHIFLDTQRRNLLQADLLLQRDRYPTAVARDKHQKVRQMYSLRASNDTLTQKRRKGI